MMNHVHSCVCHFFNLIITVSQPLILMSSAIVCSFSLEVIIFASAHTFLNLAQGIFGVMCSPKVSLAKLCQLRFPKNKRMKRGYCSFFVQQSEFAVAMVVPRHELASCHTEVKSSLRYLTIAHAEDLRYNSHKMHSGTKPNLISMAHKISDV